MWRKPTRDAQLDHLEAIVRNHRPDLLPLVAAVRAGPIDQAIADELQTVLIDEMMALGVDDRGEANPYGVQVDDLIGIVQERVFEGDRFLADGES